MLSLRKVDIYCYDYSVQLILDGPGRAMPGPYLLCTRSCYQTEIPYGIVGALIKE